MNSRVEWEQLIKNNLGDAQRLHRECGLSKADANLILDFYARQQHNRAARPPRR